VQITPYLRAFFEPAAANNRMITGEKQEKARQSFFQRITQRAIKKPAAVSRSGHHAQFW